MDFKIDAKETYTVVTPVTEQLDANMADSLMDRLEVLRQKGSKNFIIDGSVIKTAVNEGVQKLEAVHKVCYAQGESFVLTNMAKDVVKAFKQLKLDEHFNIAPKMIEAIDIVSMEILERDLLGEEE